MYVEVIASCRSYSSSQQFQAAIHSTGSPLLSAVPWNIFYARRALLIGCCLLIHIYPPFTSAQLPTSAHCASVYGRSTTSTEGQHTILLHQHQFCHFPFTHSLHEIVQRLHSSAGPRSDCLHRVLYSQVAAPNRTITGQ